MTICRIANIDMELLLHLNINFRRGGGANVPYMFRPMPLTPKTTGFRYETRVDSLTASDCVEIVCPQCKHRHLIAPYQLRLKFPPSLQLNKVANRFRCTKCGYRADQRNPVRWAVYSAALGMWSIGE